MSDFFTDQDLERLGEFIWSDDPCDDQALKQGNIIPFSWPFFCEWVGAVIDMGPLSTMFFKALYQSGETINCLLQLTDRAPYLG